MIQLRAIEYRSAAAEEQLAGSEFKYRKAWKHGNICLLVEGDCPVEPFALHNPALSLVCRTDLLTADKLSPASYIADLYQQKGDDFAAALRGTFAIILYDHRTQTLKAWTDHFGAQRLVYTEQPQYLGVSTDLRLLLALQPDSPQVDPASIQEYLQYTCIPTPRTIYKGFFRLAPGNKLLSRPKLTTQRFWDMAYDDGNGPHQPEAVWAAETLKAVEAAVGLNTKGLNNPETLGCFLSGGTDSSSIAALVGQLSGTPPRTFSIGFDDPRYNEIGYARIAAKRFNADHHEYFVKPADILSLLHKAVEVYDEPFGNSSIIPTYFCARLASEHGITHMLAGDGGDELFGGNSRYCQDRLFQRYRILPAWLRRGLVEPVVTFGSAKTGHWLPKLAASYVRRSNLNTPDRLFSYSLLSGNDANGLFTDGFLEATDGNHPLAAARRHYRAAPSQHELNRWLYLDLKITITDNDLRKVTPMAQAAGITVRYPLLDPTLAEFTGTIPPDLKVRGSRLRHIFKKAMAEVLPSEIVKKTKHGFGLPYSVWVGENKPLRDFTFDVLGSSRCRERGYFRKDLLEWIWSQYEAVHRGYYGEILWVFLMLELWHTTHQDRIVARSPELIPASHSL